jgi:hypothetical protein
MADAPRFRAYWEHLWGRSVLTMARSEWSALCGSFGAPVEISVDQTPMFGIAHRAAIVQTLAEQHSQATGQVTIVRFDAKDAPTPYNLDKYTVWTDVLAHPSLQSIISGASTELNDNFRRFAAETVFLIKQDRGPDHWLPRFPGSATTIIRST